MTTQEADELLALMRKHKVLAFELGELKVSFHPSALVDELARAESSAEPVALDPAGRPADDPDLFASAE